MAKVKLNGEFDGLGLWKKEFTTKDWKEIKTIGGMLEVSGNIPNGKYYVNIYKNDNKKTDKSPDYTLYLEEATEKKPEAIEVGGDDF